LRGRIRSSSQSINENICQKKDEIQIVVQRAKVFLQSRTGCVCVLTSSISDIYAGIDEMRIAASGCLFLLDGLRRFRQTFDFESLGCLQEGGQLVLGYVDFTCIHEL